MGASQVGLVGTKLKRLEFNITGSDALREKFLKFSLKGDTKEYREASATDERQLSTSIEAVSRRIYLRV